MSSLKPYRILKIPVCRGEGNLKTLKTQAYTIRFCLFPIFVAKNVIKSI